jgi:hypothetical protein
MLRLSLIILAVSSSVLAQAVDTSLWLEDFTQLKQEMSAHYANLEWAVAERGVDLKALSAATEDKLRAAKTEAEAKLAIQSFLQAFGDGHLRVEWSASKSGGEPSPRPAKICERLGFREWKLRPGVDFGSDKSFT